MSTEFSKLSLVKKVFFPQLSRKHEDQGKNNLNKLSWSKARLQNLEQFFSFKIGFFGSA